MKSDAISIVEAAYDCEGDLRAWRDALLARVGPQLDRGYGVSLSAYAPGMPPDEVTFDGEFARPEMLGASHAMINAYPEIFHRVLSTGRAHDTPSRAMGLTRAQARAWAPYVEHMHPLGIYDVVGLTARDPSGHAFFFSAPSPDLRRPTRREVSTWSRIAAHISAGARLRRAFPGAPSGDLSEGADAVLSPSGSVAHAEAEAQNPSARESLRGAARAIDRARSKARSNEDEALDLWQGLVAGRWSLFDRFDTDGRRFVIARKNDPDVIDPRALTLRERQVLAYAAMGHPVKLIAYSLGISPSSVSTNRQKAMRKLGLRTQADVVRLFAAASPPGAARDR
jgi:DNA-binding CsgD family transcriptional regulator